MITNKDERKRINEKRNKNNENPLLWIYSDVQNNLKLMLQALNFFLSSNLIIAK